MYCNSNKPEDSMKYLLTVLFIVSAFSIFADTYTVVTDEWAPFYGEKVPDNGYLTQIVKAAFKASGHDLQHNWMPWKRAITEAERGTYQVLMGAYYNSDRAKIFEYSEPITQTQVVFFEQKGNNIKYKKLEDLKNYKIGVVRGYSTTEEFDKAEYLIKEVSPDTKTSLKLLLNKRVDLIANSREVVLHILQQDFPEQYAKINVVQPPLQVNNLHIVVSKTIPNAKKIISDFNKGLKTIKENGTYDKILEKYGMK